MSPWPRPSSIPSDILSHAAIWPPQIWAENWGLCPFGGGELGPHLTKRGQGRGLPARQVSSWSVQPFGHSARTSQTDRLTGQIDRTDRTDRQTYNGFTNGRRKIAQYMRDRFVTTEQWPSCPYIRLTCTRVVRGSIFFDPAQPNPPTHWSNPTHHERKKFDLRTNPIQPTTRFQAQLRYVPTETHGPTQPISTQPNPACRLTQPMDNCVLCPLRHTARYLPEVSLSDV